MSRLTASEREPGKPFLSWALRGGPQDLTSRSDVVHPEELAALCHHLNSCVMGKKQELCESQEPRRALCLYFSPRILLLALATRRRSKLELKSYVLRAGGQSGRFVGNDGRGFDPGMGVTNSAGQLDRHQAALGCSTATAVSTVRPPRNGCWKTKWHVRNAELRPSVGENHKN